MANTETRTLEIIVNGQKAEASLKDMKKAAAILYNQMAKLPQGSDEFTRKQKEWKQMKQRISDAHKSSEELEKGLKASTSASEKLGKTISLAMKATVILEIIQKVYEFLKSIISTQEEVAQLEGSIQRFSGLTGDALTKATADTRALASTFGVEAEEISKSANAMAKQFGIGYDEALVMIEKGLLAGANAGGDFLDQVSEYSTQFNQAGASAEEMVAVMAKSSQEGIFSDKGADTVKEFGLRIREQTKSTSDALQQAFGAEFTEDLFAGVNDGSISTVEAMKKVSEQMNKSGVSAQQLQVVVADVFGGPGEDAGLEYLQSLKDIDGNVDNLIDSSNDLVKNQQSQLELEKELAMSQAALASEMEGSSASLDAFTTKFQILYTKGLVVVAHYLKENIGPTFSGIMHGWLEVVGQYGDVLKNLFEGNFSDINVDFSKIGDAYSNAKQEFIDNAAEQDRIAREQQEAEEIAAQEKIEAEKHRVKIQSAQKTAEELRKAREEQRKLELEADKAIQDLKLQLEEDTTQKQIDKINLDTERKIEALTGSEAQITEQKKLLLQLRDQQLEEIEAAQREAKKAAEEERKALESEELAVNEEQEKLLIEEKFLRGLATEQQREIQMYELKKKYLDAKLKLLQENGQGESLEAQKIANQLLTIEAEKNKQSLDNVDKTEQLKKKIGQSSFDTAKGFAQLAVDLLGKDEESRKKNADKIKAIQIGQTIMDGVKEVQSIWAGAATLGPIAGPIMGALQTGMAVLRTTSAISQIRAQQFAVGGATNSGGTDTLLSAAGLYQENGNWYPAQNVGSFAGGGWIPNASYGVIGEKGTEYVVNNDMLHVPQFANYVAEMENYRSGRAFAEGGSTTTSTPVIDEAPESLQNSNEEVMMLVSEVKNLTNAVLSWRSTLRANVVITDVEEGLDDLAVQRNEGIIN